MASCVRLVPLVLIASCAIEPARDRHHFKHRHEILRRFTEPNCFEEGSGFTRESCCDRRKGKDGDPACWTAFSHEDESLINNADCPDCLPVHTTADGEMEHAFEQKSMSTKEISQCCANHRTAARQPPVSDARVVVWLLGAYTGEEMHDYVRAHGAPDACLLAEVDARKQPLARKVAEQYRCTFVPAAIWDRDDTISIALASQTHGTAAFNSESLAYLTNGTINVRAVDVARLFQEHIQAGDHVIVMMDIEGAEYRVMRRLITTGLACKIRELYLETHALYSRLNFDKLPLDAAFEWILRGCEPPVLVHTSSYYNRDPQVTQLTAQYPELDAKCFQCPLLNIPIPET